MVLGVGNILLKDDGLGPLVVRQLQEFYKSPDVTFLDGGTLGLDLLAYLEGYSCLLVIDALDIGQEPGSIFCWQGKTLQGLSQQVSFHQVGLKELFHAARLLELDLEIVVMGIQAEDLSWGLELSETVQNAVPLLEEAVINRIRQYLDTEF
ncbi:MAG: hydrogenase maturation protease [Clostridia bacterium]|nr:hydrogenase expression/formation protein [Clostridiales bacterium]MDK2986070.1 hydrogenase maturation protease [Clostridia bacterium]